MANFDYEKNVYIQPFPEDSKFVPRNSVIIDSLDCGFFVPELPANNNILNDFVPPRDRGFVEMGKNSEGEGLEMDVVERRVVSEKRSKGKEKKSKKRKRDDGRVEPKDVKNVEECQDYLVTLTCSEFDEFVKNIGKFRKMSGEETSAAKEIRRRIKNRESARKCRQNRKDKLESLEMKIKKLTEKTNKQLQDISGLKMQNDCVKNEVAFIKNMIETNPVFKKITQRLFEDT